MKVFSKIIAGFMAANMFLGTTVIANAGNQNQLPSESERVYAQYRAIQEGVSSGGAILGLKSLSPKLSQSDKTLFLGAIHEIGNLPSMKIVEGGVEIVVGNRALLVEFLDAGAGRFRVGGYELNLDSESTLSSVYSRLENASSSVRFREIDKSFLEEALSAIFVKEAQAFGVVGWIIAAVIAVGVGFMLYNAGKKKGAKEARQVQNLHRGHSHGASGVSSAAEATLVEDATGDSYVANTSDVPGDANSSDSTSGDEPVIDEVAI